MGDYGYWTPGVQGAPYFLSNEEPRGLQLDAIRREDDEWQPGLPLAPQWWTIQANARVGAWLLLYLSGASEIGWIGRVLSTAWKPPGHSEKPWAWLELLPLTRRLSLAEMRRHPTISEWSVLSRSEIQGHSRRILRDGKDPDWVVWHAMVDRLVEDNPGIAPTLLEWSETAPLPMLDDSFAHLRWRTDSGSPFPYASERPLQEDVRNWLVAIEGYVTPRDIDPRIELGGKRHDDMEIALGPESRADIVLGVPAATDDDAHLAVIEAKQFARLADIDQVLRYAQALRELFPWIEVEPHLAAMFFTQETLVAAKAKGVVCFRLRWSSVVEAGSDQVVMIEALDESGEPQEGWPAPLRAIPLELEALDERLGPIGVAAPAEALDNQSLRTVSADSRAPYAGFREGIHEGQRWIELAQVGCDLLCRACTTDYGLRGAGQVEWLSPQAVLERVGAPSLREGWVLELNHGEAFLRPGHLLALVSETLALGACVFIGTSGIHAHPDVLAELDRIVSPYVPNDETDAITHPVHVHFSVKHMLRDQWSMWTGGKSEWHDTLMVHLLFALHACPALGVSWSVLDCGVFDEHDFAPFDAAEETAAWAQQFESVRPGAGALEAQEFVRPAGPQREIDRRAAAVREARTGEDLRTRGLGALLDDPFPYPA